MVVQASVADVRAKPERRSDRYDYDPLQETQVSRGEPVLVYEKKGSWARLEAPEQPEYTHDNRWEGYPGWVEWKALTKDLRLYHSLPRGLQTETELRKTVLATAVLFLGTPYLWGGRSLYDPKNKSVLTGVDCSGLVNWSFREIGRVVPRDAHEQYMRSRPVDPKALQPGDLIFVGKAEKPNKIVHVAFYYGEEEMLEGPQSGERVRKISFKEKFGKDRRELKNGMTVGERVVYFGTLFGEAS